MFSVDWKSTHLIIVRVIEPQFSFSSLHHSSEHHLPVCYSIDAGTEYVLGAAVPEFVSEEEGGGHGKNNEAK